jgi:hypothetical protein
MDIILEMLNQPAWEWEKTHLAKLPYEILEKIFLPIRKKRMKGIKRGLHYQFNRKNRCLGRNFYNFGVMYYPYVTLNNVRVDPKVHVKSGKDGTTEWVEEIIQFSKMRKGLYLYDPMFSIHSRNFMDETKKGWNFSVKNPESNCMLGKLL